MHLIIDTSNYILHTRLGGSKSHCAKIFQLRFIVIVFYWLPNWNIHNHLFGLWWRWELHAWSFIENYRLEFKPFYSK